MTQGSTDNYQRLFTEHTNHRTNLRAKVRDLEARVDKLELVCESLWGIVKECQKLSEADLMERMTQIDLTDGTFDQKKKKTSSVKCARCGRMNSKRHTKCMYCGEIYLVGPFD